MLVSYDISNNAGSSIPDNQKKFWSSIWQLQVPNKIMHFVWRLCNNALPTLVNLHRRHIVPSPSCAQCHNFPKDSLHTVWYCEAITSVWSTLEWLRQTAPPHPSTFSELLDCFLFSREEFRAELFVIIVWLLWNRRNAIHFGQPPLPVDSICSKAGSYLQEFLQAQTEEAVPPLFRRSSLAGIGVVVRNSVGEVEGAMSSPIPMAQSVADLEALAYLKAVQFALELGITRVVFEGDSAVVINALLHGAGAFASFGNILDDIRVYSAAFQFVDFTFVSRCCNLVADALAKKAKILVGAQVWLHDVPADIAPLVLLDVH
ncbi:hypothetical protein SO802_017371 [Lithocarpus litseifolius]|uniref:Reverse transcriptase zinc-binding domain-containing protein n=1 Tax=Lithocarpus litseifolius TaxID=425828 RepID=A0AAW2CJ64_9ROSI